MCKNEWIAIRWLYGLIACFVVLLFPIQTSANSVGVVSARLEEIYKEYPEGSTFDKEVQVSVMKKDGDERQYPWDISLGGCNGLVGYVTMKVFHNPFTPETTDSYKKIGKASTVDASGMRKVFLKANLGDVVEWSEHHYAIFLSSDANGIYVYEANFGGKNKVKYKNYWKWGNMKSWSHGAEQVIVWRSRNYNQVNKNKAAKNLKKGSKFTVNDITYKVTDSSITHGRAKAISGNTDIPKAVGLRYDMNKFLSKYADDAGTKRTKIHGEKEYFKWPDMIMDEQYFIIEK